jgi:hypothetical protein
MYLDGTNNNNSRDIDRYWRRYHSQLHLTILLEFFKHLYGRYDGDNKRE